MGLYSRSQSLYPCSQISTIEKIFSEHASFDETHFFSAWILRGAPVKAISPEKNKLYCEDLDYIMENGIPYVTSSAMEN